MYLFLGTATYRCGQADGLAHGSEYAQHAEEQYQDAGHIAGNDVLLALRLRVVGNPTDGAACEQL